MFNEVHICTGILLGRAECKSRAAQFVDVKGSLMDTCFVFCFFKFNTYSL